MLARLLAVEAAEWKEERFRCLDVMMRLMVHVDALDQ
jgi:hypothetical protein